MPTAGLTLSAEVSRPAYRGAPVRLRIEASEPVNIDPAVFLHQTATWGASVFSRVASVHDLESWPEHVEGDALPVDSHYFRRQTVDAMVSNSGVANQVWKLVQQRVHELILAVDQKAAAETPKPVYRSQVYTYFTLANKPDEFFRVRWVPPTDLQAAADATTEAATAVALGTPLILDLRSDPANPGQAWYADSERDSPQVFDQAVQAMSDRLDASRDASDAHEAPVALYDVPSHAGLMNAWRPGSAQAAVYEQRMEDAADLIAKQDYLVADLSMGSEQAEALAAGDPTAKWELEERAKWVAKKNREAGKQTFFAVSVTGYSAPAPQAALLSSPVLEDLEKVVADGGDRMLLYDDGGESWDTDHEYLSGLASRDITGVAVEAPLPIPEQPVDPECSGIATLPMLYS